MASIPTKGLFSTSCKSEKLKQVVAEKSLMEKKFTNRQTDKQTNKHNYRKGKNYTPPIYFVPGGGGGIINYVCRFVLDKSFVM